MWITKHLIYLLQGGIMKASFKEKAILNESKINDILEDYEDPFTLKFASVWTQTETGDMVCRGNNGDVYDLLSDEYTVHLAKNAKGFTVVTTGWAARVEDIDDDTPPSQAPNRKRVRLVVQVSDAGVFSILRFQDKPNEIVTDENTATGSLADAVNQLWKKANKKKGNK